MLEQTVKDYAAYFKLDVPGEVKSVQDVIDNMLTRLEELCSVLQMIKTKNNECASSVTDDINKYRAEVSTLSKKINTLLQVVTKLQKNVDVIEKQVEKAEQDFGVSNDNRIKSFLRPFLKKPREQAPSERLSYERAQFESVMDNFSSNPELYAE